MDLIDFIVKAKKHTYASGRKSRVLDDGFEELTFSEGDLFYRDRWAGSNPFGGEEVVMENGKAIWIMNYYGLSFSTEVDAKKVYEFLRMAMKRVGTDRPFRGPLRFSEGDFEYLDESEGSIDKFRGTERILYKGKDVYRLNYHGGRV